MADDRDDSQKTEEPTQKRLSEAEEKGDIAQSADVSSWLVLAAATGVIAMWGSSTATDLRQMMTNFLAQPHKLSIDGSSAATLVTGLGYKLFGVLALPFGMLIIIGIGAHWVQHKPTFSLEKLKPDWSRLDPLKGIGRLFGRAALVNFAKGLLKIALASSACAVVLWPARDHLVALISLPVSQLLPTSQTLMMNVLIATLAILAVVAIADYGFQYFERRRRLMMTRQELREEFKQSEGDPTVKAKLRQIRSERSRKRMMANVPKASVIITNPTHYAVAIQYETGKMGAPIVVAKGVDSIALKIREIGKEHNVPIVENPPLARALYASVDVDESIKPEHYKAVAQVIGFVMRLKNKVAATKKPPIN